MAEITPLRRDQVDEAKRVIYTTAFEIFGDRSTLEEAIAYYQSDWPLNDVDDFEDYYSAGGGIFLVASEGGRIVGTGALRRLDDTTGEIKRLWFLPAYHGQGMGYAMMMKLLEVAREKGFTRVRLETSPPWQPRAYEFYKRLGFYEIPRYSDHPEDGDSVGMELML